MKIDFSGDVLIAYITAGLPNISVTAELLLELQSAGVSAIEVGIPYSDPVADGKTIARASHISLESGTNLDSIFTMLKGVIPKMKIPIYLMSYYAPIFKYGEERLIEEMKSSGVTGMIFPDLTFDEGKETFEKFKKAGLDPIHLCFPNVSDSRLAEINNITGSFIYFVNLFGTTGMRESIPESSLVHLKDVKEKSKKPICAGFGVSSRDMFEKLSSYADGVIIGSAIVKRVLENGNNIAKAKSEVNVFIRSILNR